MIICYTVPETWLVMDVIVMFYFGLFFALIPHQQPKKTKLKKKWMHGDIIILHKRNKNHDNMLYCSWEIYCSWVTDVIVIFHFGLFFALLPHWQPKKTKLKKNNEKKPGDIIISCIPKIMIRWCTVLKHGVRQTDRQMNRWKDGKSNIQRWVPHLKILCGYFHFIRLWLLIAIMKRCAE